MLDPTGERPMTDTDAGSDPDPDADSDGGNGTGESAGRERPLSLFDHLDTVRDRLAHASGLLLCTDFDGTLAPITDDPGDTEITAANEEALRTLADREGVAVAAVSGRAVEDVADRIGIEGIAYAGNHGLELARDGDTTVHPPAAARVEDIEAVLGELEDRLGEVDGCVFEDKGVTATIHYRQAASEDVPTIETAVDEALDEYGERLECSSGKEVFEIGPAIPWDKGQVVSLLAEDTPEEWIGAYLGDDTTDETAFRALGEDGISVFVGDETEETAAQYRVPDPEGVARFLEWLTDEGTEAIASDRSPGDR
jgi:trehalose 6-phosphate phosphatase